MSSNNRDHNDMSISFHGTGHKHSLQYTERHRLWSDKIGFSNIVVIMRKIDKQIMNMKKISKNICMYHHCYIFFRI